MSIELHYPKPRKVTTPDINQTTQLTKTSLALTKLYTSQEPSAINDQNNKLKGIVDKFAEKAVKKKDAYVLPEHTSLCLIHDLYPHAWDRIYSSYQETIIASSTLERSQGQRNTVNALFQDLIEKFKKTDSYLKANFGSTLKAIPDYHVSDTYLIYRLIFVLAAYAALLNIEVTDEHITMIEEHRSLLEPTTEYPISKADTDAVLCRCAVLLMGAIMVHHYVLTVNLQENLTEIEFPKVRDDVTDDLESIDYKLYLLSRNSVALYYPTSSPQLKELTEYNVRASMAAPKVAVSQLHIYDVLSNVLRSEGAIE